MIFVCKQRNSSIPDFAGTYFVWYPFFNEWDIILQRQKKNIF